jgi:hypothetical protein
MTSASSIELEQDDAVQYRRRLNGTLAPRSLVALLSAWLGATLFFGAAVAPAAFDVLESRDLAGELVGRVLPALLLTGVVIGIVMLGIALSRIVARQVRRVLLIGGVIMAASCGAAYFVVNPAIDGMRAAAGKPVAELAATDPVRVRFGRMHALSVGLLGLAWIGGVVVLLAAGITRRSPRGGAPR